MLIAIDESGDFAPGSPRLSFFVAVLLQQQHAGVQTKEIQFREWLTRIPTFKINQNGEVKGSDLTESELLDFAQSVISAYPPVKIDYVRFRPSENPAAVVMHHKSADVANLYLAAEQRARDGQPDLARQYTRMAIWYKNVSRMNYQNYMKLVLLRKLIVQVLSTAIGVSMLIELLHRDPEHHNLLNLAFKIDRDFVRGPDPLTYWKEVLRSSFMAAREGIPLLDEWEAQGHPFLKKYPPVGPEFLDLSDVFNHHCNFYDSHDSFEVQIADITSNIFYKYFNRGLAKEAYTELWATTSRPGPKSRRPAHLILAPVSNSSLGQ